MSDETVKTIPMLIHPNYYNAAFAWAEVEGLTVVESGGTLHLEGDLSVEEMVNKLTNAIAMAWTKAGMPRV